MSSLRDLEEQGSAEIGVALMPAQQTTGGLTNLLITRRYKVRSADVGNYLYQILNASVRITDPAFTDAYLVRQSVSGYDQSNGILTCQFAQIPQEWDEAFFNAVTFPGVSPSSLYEPVDFPWRSGSVSFETQARYNHKYFLGPINSIPTVPKFAPVDMFGNRVSQIDDWTTPSADEYVGMIQSRQEICVSSVVLNWMGDIWDRRTLYAIAK